MSSAKQERTKVVVRNLPPTLTEESFRAAVDKVAEGRYDWMAYYTGKVSLKRTLHSRGYLHLLTPADVVAFKERFDGHVFVSSKGSQYRCSVEYAPFQRVPNPPTKKPAMEGTVESDPDYQAFLKRLEEGPQSLPSATAQLEAREAEGRAAADGSEGGKRVVVTPLMEYLRKKYAGGVPLRRGGGKGRGRAVQRLEVVEELVVAPQVPATAETKGKKGRAAKGAAAAASGGKDAGSDAVQAATGPAPMQPVPKQGQAGKREAKQQRGQQQQQQDAGGAAAQAGKVNSSREGGTAAGAKGSGRPAHDAANQGPRTARAPKQAATPLEAPSSARHDAPAQLPGASPGSKGGGKARPGSAAGSSARGGGQDRSAAAAAAAAPALLARPSSAIEKAEKAAPMPEARGASASVAAAQAATAASGADGAADGDGGSAARRPRGLAAGGPRNRLFASALQKAAGPPKGGGRQQQDSEKTGQG